MKKLYSVLICLGLSPLVLGQYNIDYGFKVGGANYLGEMGGKEKTRRDFIWDIKMQQTSFSAGGFFRYKFNSLVSANVGVMYGRIKGDDALSTNVGRRGRNLSFRNDIIDIYARGEIYVYNEPDVGNRGRYRVDFKSFVFGGISGFHHNPKARNENYNGGAWTELRPLMTEGVSYGKWGLSIPVGVGLFFTYRREHRFGWEIGWHTTFTDYLDDVSTQYPEVNGVADPSLYYVFTNRSGEVPVEEMPEGGENGLANYYPGEKRGDPTHNDTYIFTNLTYSYVIKGPNSFYRQNYSWIGRKRKSRRKVRAKF